MSDANNGRPLPWHDTANCNASDAEYAGVAARKGKCGGPMVSVSRMANGFDGPRDSRIACCACGKARRGTPEDVEKVARSDRAFDLWAAGRVHADRGCAKCNGPLLLERERLCGPCVERDVADRQCVLFSETGNDA